MAPQPDSRGTALAGVSATGLTTGVGSYLIWGFFPLYFILLRGVDPIEVAAHRILWAGVVLLAVVAITRTWRDVARVLRDRPNRNLLLAAAALIGVVWFVYGYGALTGRAVDVALGYFICPLVTLVLAVVANKERLGRVQVVSALLVLVGVVVVTAGYGRFPWIAVVIALSFAGYSLVKNRVSRSISATTGLAVETAFLFPVALATAVVLTWQGEQSFLSEGPAWTDLWLIVSGPMTVLPLLLFSAAAQRLPLSVLGNVQYLNPALQLVSGVVILGEDMPLARWIGFALVWVALGLVVVDAALTRRALLASRRRTSPLLASRRQTSRASRPGSAGPPATNAE